MAYDARSVANELLRIAISAGRRLTNMQVQKLVYIAHGYSLAILREPLIKQMVQAWRYGPVVPDLYHALRKHGSGVVTEPINILSREKLSETDRVLLTNVEKAYARFTGPQLSTMTHREGTPWRQVYDPKAEFNNDVIPNDLIQQHYLTLLNERAGIIPE
ncbi:MAG TPA: type II toxin-antitoxin system antitoxin SocA domain-containing protein [Pyrinomonadaceae bacterium]|nr:type II toxin-antitoxin system antitoxin SocA domain-containing protein [Pyrinomonadaceae bacterium]